MQAFLKMYCMFHLCRHHKWLNESLCPDFNAGVVGYNLNKWRAKNITREVIYWMSERYKQLLWGLGTQPILFVISVDDWKKVSRKWNFLGLAYEKHSMKSVENGFILHWNGLGIHVPNTSHNIHVCTYKFLELAHIQWN